MSDKQTEGEKKESNRGREGKSENDIAVRTLLVRCIVQGHNGIPQLAVRVASGQKYLSNFTET